MAIVILEVSWRRPSDTLLIQPKLWVCLSWILSVMEWFGWKGP